MRSNDSIPKLNFFEDVWDQTRYRLQYLHHQLSSTNQ